MPHQSLLLPLGLHHAR